MSIKQFKNFWFSYTLWDSYGGPYSLLPSIHLDLHPEASGTGLSERESSATRLVFSFWTYRIKLEFGKFKHNPLEEANWNVISKYGKSKYGKDFPNDKKVKDWCMDSSENKAWVRKLLSLTGTNNHYTRLIIVRNIMNDLNMNKAG
jgi:hypothetical protein